MGDQWGKKSLFFALSVMYVVGIFFLFEFVLLDVSHADKFKAFVIILFCFFVRRRVRPGVRAHHRETAGLLADGGRLAVHVPVRPGSAGQARLRPGRRQVPGEAGHVPRRGAVVRPHRVRAELGPAAAHGAGREFAVRRGRDVLGRPPGRRPPRTRAARTVEERRRDGRLSGTRDCRGWRRRDRRLKIGAHKNTFMFYECIFASDVDILTIFFFFFFGDGRLYVFFEA